MKKTETGVHIKYWGNGNKSLEIPYIGEKFIDGITHGILTAWNEDGTKQSESYFDNGEEVVATSYFPDGKVEDRTYQLPHKNNGTNSGLVFTKPHNNFRGGRTEDTEHWITKTWKWFPNLFKTN